MLHNDYSFVIQRIFHHVRVKVYFLKKHIYNRNYIGFSGPVT